jgi:hypothetical protein
MSQFYDLASLVVIPSGYKASTIYAQKPLTTDGQLSFSRASTATRVNASGLIEAVASNVPRLDYTNSSCPRLLLEPQRTNFITYSEQFNNAAWTSATFTVSANTTVSPDGTQDADTLPFTASAASNIYQFPTTSATGDHVFTIYAKVASGTKTFRLRIDTGSGPAVSNDFTATTTWQRFTFAFTSTNVNLVAYVFNGTNGAAGNLIVWGAQLEAGAYATSYIPTLGASVTRVADAASKTGISSLIGQTEGTIFGEMYTNPNGTESLLTWTRNSTAGIYGNFIYLGTNSAAQIRVQVVQAGAQQVEILGSALSVGWHKFAFAYKLNDFALYVDGVQIGTASSGTIPTGMDQLFIDQYIDGGIRNASKKQVLLFKTRLTNAQLAELTTL